MTEVQKCWIICCEQFQSASLSVSLQSSLAFVWTVWEGQDGDWLSFADVLPLIYNYSHVLTAEGHPVTNRKRKEETNSMCSSRSYAPCCRVRDIRARWTSPPYCRELLTSCRNRKVGKASILSLLWTNTHSSCHVTVFVFFRHHCSEWNLRHETGLEAVVPQ